MKPLSMTGFTTLCRLMRKRWLIALAPLAVLTVMVGVANFELDDAAESKPESIRMAQASVEVLPVSLDVHDPEHPRIKAQLDVEKLHAFASFLDAADIRNQIYHAYQERLKNEGKLKPLAQKQIDIDFSQDARNKSILLCTVQTRQTTSDHHALTLTALGVHELTRHYLEQFNNAGSEAGMVDAKLAHQHLAETEKRLNETIREIETFKSTHQIVDFPVQKTTADELSLMYRTLLSQSKSNQSQLKAKYKALLNQLGEPTFSATAFRQRLESDEVLSKLQHQWLANALQLERLRATLPTGDPKVKESEAMAITLQNAFADRLANAQPDPHAAGTKPVRLQQSIPATHLPDVNPHGQSSQNGHPPVNPDQGIIPAVNKAPTLTGILESKTYQPLTPSQIQLMDALADTTVQIKGNQTKISGFSTALTKQERTKQVLSEAEYTLMEMEAEKARLEAEYDRWSEVQDRHELVEGLMEHNQLEMRAEPHLLKGQHVPHPNTPFADEALLNDPVAVSLMMLSALALGVGGALLQEKLAPEAGEPSPSNTPNGSTPPRNTNGRTPLRKRPENDKENGKISGNEPSAQRVMEDAPNRITIDLSCLESPLEFLARLNLSGGPVSSAFESLVKQLRLPAVGSSFKAPRIAVSGNSLIAAGLAASLARQGEKTCLLEISEDSALLEHLFHLDSPWGLSEVLSNELDAEDLIAHAKTDSPIKNLTILSRGIEAMPLDKQGKGWDALVPFLLKRYERLIFCLPDIGNNVAAFKLLQNLQPQHLLWVENDEMSEKTWEKHQAELGKLAPQCKLHRVL